MTESSDMGDFFVPSINERIADARLFGLEDVDAIFAAARSWLLHIERQRLSTKKGCQDEGSVYHSGSEILQAVQRVFARQISNAAHTKYGKKLKTHTYYEVI